MESIIEAALKKPRSITYSEDNPDNFDFGPQIYVVGCGGAGNNTVKRLNQMGISGAKTIVIDTDGQHANIVNANNTVLFSNSLTNGLGPSDYPDFRDNAAMSLIPTLEGLFKATDLVFVTAGMGGETGTFSANTIAQVASEEGAIVICLVTYPFRDEKDRVDIADEGLGALKTSADSVIVLDYNLLKSYIPNFSSNQVYSAMDQLISETIKEITELITKPSLINIDFADLRAIFGKGGVSTMMVGESAKENTTDTIVMECLTKPMLDVDYHRATGCFICISGPEDLSLVDAEEIASSITYELDPHADVIWGAQINPEMKGRVRVHAIISGLSTTNLTSNKESYREMMGHFNKKGSSRKLFHRDMSSGGSLLDIMNL